jgi:tetratricopeptide (TPR) repeat protein
LNGDVEGARRDLDAALTSNGNCAAALIGRGDLAFAEEDDSGAQRDYDELVRLRPESALAAVRRGRLFWKRGQFGPAAHDAQRACKASPTYDEAYVVRGLVARSTGHWSDAARDFEIAAELDPTNAEPHRESAWLFAACPDPAIRDARRAITLAERACNLTNWKDYRSLAALAAARAESGDFGRALELQQQAIDIAPTSGREPLRRALAEYQADRPSRLTTPIVEAGLAPPREPTVGKPTSPTKGPSVFTSEVGRFRAEFPASPKEETFDSAARRHHVTRADVDGVTYFVDYSDFTADELRQAGSPERLLKSICDKVAGDAKVVGEKPLEIGDSRGTELVLEPRPDERAIFHIYLVGLRAYQVATLGKLDTMRAQQAVLERFYESFQVRSGKTRAPTQPTVLSAEARYGRLGPPRKSWRYQPFDVLYAHLETAGFAADADGRINVDGTLEFLGSDGPAAPKKTFAFHDRPVDGRLPIDVLQEIIPLPGDYRLRVSLHDRAGDVRLDWEQAVVIEPVSLAIVAPSYFRDADGKTPAPGVAKVGESLYLEFRVIGFDRSQDRIDTAMNLQLIDEQGKPMLTEPVRSAVKTDDAAVVQKNQVVTYSAKLPLLRATQATVRVTVLDLIGGDAAKLELPLKIIEP